MITSSDDGTLDDAPPGTLALWIRLVRTMDAAMLASFVNRSWRTWSRELLAQLEAAVKGETENLRAVPSRTLVRVASPLRQTSACNLSSR